MENCIRECADKNQLNRCAESLEEISLEIQQIASILNIAGNEVRLKIFHLLNEEQEMCPCDLSDVLQMTVPAISQHLKKMKTAKLLFSEKRSQTIYYSINYEESKILLPMLESLKQVSV